MKKCIYAWNNLQEDCQNIPDLIYIIWAESRFKLHFVTKKMHFLVIKFENKAHLYITPIFVYKASFYITQISFIISNFHLA